MAKRIDKDLYKAVRAGGVRKRVARTVAEAATMAKDTGGKAPEALRNTAKDLRALADTLEDRATGGPAKRAEAAQKAARTRKRKAGERSAAAKRGAKTRASSGGSRASSRVAQHEQPLVARAPARARRAPPRARRAPRPREEHRLTRKSASSGGRTTRSRAQVLAPFRVDDPGSVAKFTRTPRGGAVR